MRGTFSSAISTPRSPRATITPSASSRIASIFSHACGFSILATIGIVPRRFQMRPQLRTSSAVRTKESATMSTPVLESEVQVGQIFLGERRSADLHAGQVDALVIADRRRRDTTSHAPPPSELESTSSTQPSASRMRSPASRPGRSANSRWRRVRSAHHLFGGDGKRRCRSAARAAFEEFAEANLGTLQIEQNAAWTPRSRGERADRVDARRMFVLRAVRGVEAKNIDAGARTFG